MENPIATTEFGLDYSTPEEAWCRFEKAIINRAKTIIYNWLNLMYSKYGLLTPLGHGVSKDIDIITKYTLSTASWENFVSNIIIDTASLFKFFITLKKFDSPSYSLVDACKHFGLSINENKLHQANYDALLNIRLFSEIYKSLKPY
jgi:hypothetical protein